MRWTGSFDGVWPLLSDVLGTRLGRRLVPVTGDDAHLAQVRVVHEPDLPEEGYRLEVAGAAGPGRRPPASSMIVTITIVATMTRARRSTTTPGWS